MVKIGNGENLLYEIFLGSRPSQSGSLYETHDHTQADLTIKIYVGSAGGPYLWYPLGPKAYCMFRPL